MTQRSLGQPPYLTSAESFRAPMADVMIALLPVLAMSCYFFGLRALTLTLVSVATCVGAEFAYGRLFHRPFSIHDLSAAVTGMLLAFCLPVTAPYWAAVLGGVFAIVVVKQLFGGLGRNFMNPALAGRAFLCAFPGVMSHWASPMQMVGLLSGADAVTSATPLSYLDQGVIPSGAFTLRQLFLGQCGGSMGEVSALMILLGGVYLVLRKVISPRIPLCFLGTVAVLTWLFPRGNDPTAWMLYQLLSGGLMLGAVFMATDYVTSPVTRRGQMVYAVGCGVLTVIIRYFGSLPEGVGCAILVMNTGASLLDHLCRPRPFGAPGLRERLAREKRKEGAK